MRALFFLTIYYSIILTASAEEILLRDLDVQSSPRLSEYLAAQKIPMDFPVKDLLLRIDDRNIESSLYGEIGGAIRENENLTQDEKIALTDLFVTGLNDEDQRYYVSDRLRLPPFEKEYFSAEAKGIILEQGIDHIRNNFYLRILAVADIEDPKVDTKSMSESANAFTGATNDILGAMEIEHFAYYSSDLWTSLVVEARKGNDEALDRLLNNVRNIDKLRMTARPEVVEDLGFVRQPEAVDVLVDFLFSDVPSEDAVMTGHVGVIPLSFRAAKALSMSLADYPLDYWDHYEYEKVQQMREFIRNYEGDWRIIGKPQPEAHVVKTPAPKKVVEQALEPEVKEPVEVTPVEVVEETPEQSSQWWLWLVGALIVVGGLGLVLRRKS